MQNVEESSSAFHALATKSWPATLALTFFLGAACSGQSPPTAGTGGAPGSGGAGTAGGAPASGGANLGGASGSGAGGASGAASGLGGYVGSGGTPLGGASSTGGVRATGGGAATGGTVATGGTSNSGGANATGGNAGAGGANATGGNSGTGGASATGGKAGTGGAAGAGSCLTPPPAEPVQGWAAVAGMNQATTTGGGNAAPQIVTSLGSFRTAVGGTTPAVIYLNAKLEPAAVAVGSNKTIVGVCGAEFHGHLGFSGSANVIVRNLKIVGYGVGDCSKDPDWDASVGCSSGVDAVTISKASHHIWFDHCDVSDGTDGNLDINSGSDFITISWTKFHYTPRTDNVGEDATGANGHRYSNLIGSGDNVPEDVGHLNVTWHHNWWADNVNQRMPRTRRGKIHVVNNLYTSVGNSYCTNSGFETHVLVENNVYIGVKNPLSPDANGDMLERNNVFTNTTGTMTASGVGFTPPYSYTPEGTGTLEAAIRSGVGPR